jgi:hypothetical protein
VNAYAAIADAFPASVTVERATDALGDVVTFRIAATAKLSVAGEIERIVELTHERAWVRVLGPVRWQDEYIAWGELRERMDVPK